MRKLLSLFVLQGGDPDLARAQFRSMTKQIPLLYMILVCNALAISFEFYQSDLLLRTLLTPLIICSLAIVRGYWWWKQTDSGCLPDQEIFRLIKRTCNLAVVMTLAFTGWCLWLYQLGNAHSRGHLVFFLALTQVSSVFCLMPVRAAAMRVAATCTSLFVGYFILVGEREMFVSSVVLFFVSLGMMVVTFRYNKDFSELIGSQRDLKMRQVEAERLSEENRRVALTDALSGLPNRRKLLNRLDGLEKRPDMPTDSLAIIFIDLDGFKEINDAHGHHAGDALISSLSERLQELCPDYATLTRVGGDEFAILLETTGATKAAQTLAEKINEEICLPVLVDRHVLQVGASIGIAANSESHSKGHELLRRADTAMYHVKMAGKGAVAIYDTAFDQGRLHRLAIENQIGRGLANDEFEVFYQPVVDAHTGAILAAEALLRWPRRAEGPLDLEQVIEIAESTGQIHPLGQFVLDRACRDFRLLDGLKLSVNVSPSQFHDPDFERKVAAILQQARFPNERMQLEITEGYLLNHPEKAINAIRTFKNLGMSIALDDFGTGFTSIHYLQSYGFSHIKIDKSLLEGLSPNSKTSSLITGAIHLARGLDMRVIVEGVETEEQAAILRSVGCHNLQGYLFGCPMPFEEFVRVYHANRQQIKNASRIGKVA